MYRKKKKTKTCNKKRNRLLGLLWAIDTPVHTLVFLSIRSRLVQNCEPGVTILNSTLTVGS